MNQEANLAPFMEASGFRLKIKRAFGLFEGLAPDVVGIDHGGPYIAVPQQLLNRTDIIIGLQQMTGPASAG